jgi:hypothetical protein
MNVFDDLRQKAQTTLSADEAKVKGWWATHWHYIAAGAVLLVLGFIAGKL